MHKHCVLIFNSKFLLNHFKMIKKTIAFIGLCTIMLNSIGCSSEHTEHEEETEFLVTSPLRMDTSLVKEYVSQIHAIQHIEIRAQERGYLQDIFVDEGQFVRQGQLLFRVMPRLYEAEWQHAKAEADFAEIEFENTKRLADSGIVSNSELALAQAQLAKANADLALAKVHLDFTEIRAPFDGFIDRFHVRLGSLIEEGDLLTNLSDNHKMWVYYNVPESEYLEYMSQLKKDSLMQVELKMANGKQFNYNGIVETIEADFNNETGNIAFRATFPNPKGLLRHGETGNIQMTVPLKNSLLIPQKATFEVLDKRYVFVINANDEVEAREIHISYEMPHIYAVTGGLDEDEKFLLEGLRLVKAGDKISYEFEAPKHVLADLDLYAE